MPAGGYYTPPLRFYGDTILASGGSKAIQLRVSADSPALATGVGTTTRFVNAKTRPAPPPRVWTSTCLPA